MVEPAQNLVELHALHQRAKAIRDRLASGPRTLASREKVLAARRADLEKAQKALKDARAHTKNQEVRVKSIDEKIDDLRTKLNQARKQLDFDAIRNQMAHEQASKSRIEDEILQAFETIETQAAAVAAQEQEAAALEAEVAALRSSIEAARDTDELKLAELEAALAASESILPEDRRDQYRRVVKQQGSDAMAAVEDGSCTGCFQAPTAQLMNDLINGGSLIFCRSCGRILYLPENSPSRTRRTPA